VGRSGGCEVMRVAESELMRRRAASSPLPKPSSLYPLLVLFLVLLVLSLRHAQPPSSQRLQKSPASIRGDCECRGIKEAGT
jgi:hypothetical protein